MGILDGKKEFFPNAVYRPSLRTGEQKFLSETRVSMKEL